VQQDVSLQDIGHVASVRRHCPPNGRNHPLEIGLVHAARPVHSDAALLLSDVGQQNVYRRHGSTALTGNQSTALTAASLLAQTAPRVKLYMSGKPPWIREARAFPAAVPAATTRERHCDYPRDLVRGFEAREVPADWRQHLGL
jgi:hypothetical protein